MVVASDGVYDNLYDEDVLECINKPESLGEGQFNHQYAADCLANKALKLGNTKGYKSPFALGA